MLNMCPNQSLDYQMYIFKIKKNKGKKIMKHYYYEKLS